MTPGNLRRFEKLFMRTPLPPKLKYFNELARIVTDAYGEVKNSHHVLYSRKIREHLFGFKENTMSKIEAARYRACASRTASLSRKAAIATVVLILSFAAWASADIFDDWAKVQPPPPPELKPVKLDGATTAFLILDMVPPQCDHNPRCAATVPKIKQLHDAARKAGAMFWYAVPGRDAKPEEVYSGFRPQGDAEWEPIQGPDKFRGNSKLEDKLKARGIKTAIICGHSFQGVG